MFGAGIFGKTLMDVNLARQVRVVEVRDITQHLSFGSSSMFMPAEQHWSTREKHEPLYL